MKIAFKNFGCRTNSLDTDALVFEAKSRGHHVVSIEDPTDAYLINSCTVTMDADRDTRREIQRYRRQNPLSLIGVLGCYPQVAKEELLAHSEVDFVVGTANKTRAIEILESVFESAHWERDRVMPPTGFLPARFLGSRNARANIKIQDGCNFSCSFCIIPSARGKSRSLPEGTVLQQIQDAADQGFNEVVLTGIHLAHYGWDLNTSLTHLLQKILRGSGPRIRLSTLDPFEISDEMLQFFCESERLCPYLHIALQSGSNRILKRMKRLYQAEEFVEVTEKLYKANPRIFIGVDVIVGFPGEDEEAFTESLQCLENSKWTKLHVFPYSERKGTLASTFQDRVDPFTVRKRCRELLRVSEKRYSECLSLSVGQTFHMIIEKTETASSPSWFGHTENFLPAYLSAPGVAPKEVHKISAVGKMGRGLIAVMH